MFARFRGKDHMVRAISITALADNSAQLTRFRKFPVLKPDIESDPDRKASTRRKRSALVGVSGGRRQKRILQFEPEVPPAPLARRSRVPQCVQRAPDFSRAQVGSTRRSEFQRCLGAGP